MRWRTRADKLNKRVSDNNTKLVARVLAVVQKFSLPLLLGVVAALVFANAYPSAYSYFVGADHHGDFLSLAGDWDFLGHPLTFYFLVNDIFMVFFFGLAAKEVTEALLPGGSLNPPSKAISPLLATIGGVVGPVAMYLLLCYVFHENGSFDGDEFVCSDDHDGDDAHRLLSSSSDCEDVTLETVLGGWGVPTATDISLAWMVAVMVFGVGHRAIGFLLLLAVVDDGIGLVIIAVFYPDPENPVELKWLPLIPAGMLVAFIMRRLDIWRWQEYVFIPGVISWFGFLMSHVHPALALVPIVPFLPAGEHHEEHNHAEMAQTPISKELAVIQEKEAHLGHVGTFPKDEEAASFSDTSGGEMSCWAGGEDALGGDSGAPGDLGGGDGDLDVQASCWGGTDVRAGDTSSSPRRLSDELDVHVQGGAPGSTESDVEPAPTQSAPSLEHAAQSAAEEKVEAEARQGEDDDASHGVQEKPKAVHHTHHYHHHHHHRHSFHVPGTNINVHVPHIVDVVVDEFLHDVHVVDEFVHHKIHDVEEYVHDFHPMEWETHHWWQGPADHHHHDSHWAPLHKFEDDLKLIVDFGMFFFALVNAGVQFSTPGGMTISVLLALVLGKTLGIVSFTLIGDKLFGAKVPEGISYADVCMIGFIASIGLTVALFVAGQAFTHDVLQQEAKMGALLSALSGLVAILIAKYCHNFHYTKNPFYMKRTSSTNRASVAREGDKGKVRAP